MQPTASLADDTAPYPADYGLRAKLNKFITAECPTINRSLTLIKGNLYRHTSGTEDNVHSGLVLITHEGALVVDPASTCTAKWLLNEIQARFDVPIRYVIYSHADPDHISGGGVLQDAGATVVASDRALETIISANIATALPTKVFDKDLRITLGGETVLLHHIAPIHSTSMVMVLFPEYKALQCTDVCEDTHIPGSNQPVLENQVWFETLSWVVKQDVEIIEMGHYTPPTRRDQEALRTYQVDRRPLAKAACIH